ncbi:MAG: hypothetical protein AB1295_02285 [Candidatus Micrarchaeota archaeon]
MADESLDILDESLGAFDSPEESKRIMDIHEENTASLVEFYKQLVEMGEGEIPKRMLEEAGRSERMDSAENLLDNKLKLLKEGKVPLNEEAALMTQRLCLAHFLLDRARKLEELSVKSDNISLYCLYLSLEERICDMLSEEYYGSSFMDIMGEYIDTEPVLSACSELCGLVVPSVEEIMKEMRESWLKQQLLLP